jgi:hypothetical protein
MRTLPLIILLAACGGEPPEPPKPACTLSLDGLEGTTWVMDDPQPDGTTKENLMARMQFRTEDGQLKMDYTVKSPVNSYTFDCTRKGEGGGAELECFEPPRIKDWCLALEAFEEGSCTPPELREYGIPDSVSKSDVVKAIKEAKAEVKKMKEAKAWEKSRIRYNNLGNPLQGRVYVAVNARTCTLKITDNYMTIYNGEQKEDSNPVGTNPFVKYEAGPLLFESCGPGRIVADLETEELPDKLPAPPKHEFGTDIWYHYVGGESIKPEDGCAYSMDTWAQWKPVSTGVEAPIVDGKVVWKAKHAFGDADKDALHQGNPMAPMGVFSMVRYKDCAGKKEKIDTVCGVASYVADPAFMPPPPPQK